MGTVGEKFCPSNGTEGMIFMSVFCERCIHEKFIHTQMHGDKGCEILDDSMIYDIKDPEYPKQWTYDSDGHGTCTEWKLWNWRTSEGELNCPEEKEPVDPNQLSLIEAILEAESQSGQRENDFENDGAYAD